MSGTSSRRRRIVVLGTTIVSCAAGLVVASGARATTSASSPLVLRMPGELTTYSYDGDVYLDNGPTLQSTGQKFELWSHRAGYSSPVTTTMYRGARATRLPTGTTDTLAGLSQFLDVSVQNSKGDVVLHRTPTICLNGQTVRAQPTGAGHSNYPYDCAYNLFARGSVQGIAAGWATTLPLLGSDNYDSIPLAVGSYTVDVSITPKYRSLFGIAAADGRASTTLTVKKEDDGGVGVRPRPAAHRAPAASSSPAAPTSKAPTGTRLAAAPATGPRPDLVAAPAWGIGISGRGNYLSFAATVWNAGTSPLVVDGFRRGDEDVMDAYQYFYDAKGHQTGYVPAGQMEWDGRPSHNHWHFEDFARYTLLRADKQTAVVSDKEAFCLADTDAMDYTLPGADWQPYNTDLATACGDHSSVAVSEVLAVGSGDTYEQYRAGQSFSLKGLANGIYYVAVQANPANVLSEVSTTNNTALRKVRIGGTTDHRTVYVYPVGDVTG